ncbi:MAG TPA: CbiX/SirB N-terminal domain-containing protein [Nitrospirota bacterium]|nr:CbiX/SirB N-terminal domain-containing protein [Nitrospirota bacterium]
MKKAVILLGHGSRNVDADGTIRRVASEVKGSGGFEIVAYAFLQYMKPGPDEVLEQCVKEGAEMIVVVPFFLQPGAHVTKDLPALIEKARMQYPDVGITVTELVGSHPLMTDIVLELAKKHN